MTLIARLEQAEVGSDALDREIADACSVKWSADEEGNYGGYNILPKRCYFSRSIDAALTLVPEGWTWNIHHGFAIDAECFFSSKGPLGTPEKEVCVHDAVSPALALCIAALRARGLE